jgi:hypothetical protein
MRVGVLACSSVLFVAGCATGGEAPDAMLTETETSINDAIEADATNYAPDELQEAQKQLDYAKNAIEDENYEEARRFLSEAQVTAEYASVKSRSAKSQEAAETIRQDIETLRQELGSS